MIKINTLNGFESVLGIYYITEGGEVYSDSIKKNMKQAANRYGYKAIRLKKDGVREWKNAYVHRLVALAFLENKKDLPMVNHKNEIKSDNTLNNLEWCDATYNINYGTAIKRMKETKNKKPIKVYNIFGELLEVGLSANDAGRKYMGSKQSEMVGRFSKGFFFVENHIDLNVCEMNEMIRESIYNPIVTIDIKDGYKLLFRSMKEVRRYFGTTTEIVRLLKSGGLIKKRYKVERYVIGKYEDVKLAVP